MVKMILMSSIRLITNKAPSVPSMPAPVAAAAPPTVDNSEEIKKQRAIEAERAKREKGLSATDNTGGEGVPLAEENTEKKTLLGQ